MHAMKTRLRIFALTAKNATIMIAEAAISRRFIGVWAAGIAAYAVYPIAEPTSDLSLKLAQGTNSVEVSRKDPFAVNVRNVAARVGVKNPSRLSVRLSEDTAGASVGSNWTITQRGACIVLPLELYDAFHATKEEHARFSDIPKKDEIDFVLAHESAHIARNHGLKSGLFLPLSLVLSTFAIRKIPNRVISSVVGACGLVASNILLSWHLEHEADHIAALNGYARGGIDCFERKLSRNCEARSLLDTHMITPEGNYLGDTSHPLLTSRVERLKAVADHHPLIPSPLAVSSKQESSCTNPFR